tara:strand:+ start:831 stop:1517 length:687 start_codon:yes stop_codon:yes gene_type:complete
MKIGIGITMFNEHSVVLQTIKNIIKCKDFVPYIVVAHSDDENLSTELEEIKKLADEYTLLPNLGKEYESERLGAYCITRNYSSIFSILNEREFDVVVGLTGDTLVTDPTNFLRRSSELGEGQVAYIAQAIGQNFHTPNGPDAGRPQHQEITDMMPQLFILKGSFAYTTKCFSHISVVNEYTSEHCLGDELGSHVEGDFHEKVRRLNALNPTYAYAYEDGIKYHIRTVK